LKIEGEVSKPLGICLSISIFDDRPSLDHRHRKHLRTPYPVVCSQSDSVEEISLIDFNWRSIRADGSSVNIAYSAQLYSIGELNFGISPPAIIEDLDPDVDLETGAIQRGIVQLALTEKNGSIGITVSELLGGHLQLLLGNRFPACRRSLVS
jgi:hypothetical protein